MSVKKLSCAKHVDLKFPLQTAGTLLIIHFKTKVPQTSDRGQCNLSFRYSLQCDLNSCARWLLSERTSSLTVCVERVWKGHSLTKLLSLCLLPSVRACWLFFTLIVRWSFSRLMVFEVAHGLFFSKRKVRTSLMWRSQCKKMYGTIQLKHCAVVFGILDTINECKVPISYCFCE